MKGLFIKQKMDTGEVLCGCNNENLYHCYNAKPDGSGKKGHKLFRAKEKSGCCNRNFCKGPSRPLKIDVTHVSIGSEKDGDPFLEIEKPCVCFIPGCCCMRPEVIVHNIEKNSREILGHIYLPW